ncbi:MAG: hypothetical protein J7K78_04530 [Thaumarchaeota archaeon]|nr:hypothetical protein [Nitrososphaerota archaeon]
MPIDALRPHESPILDGYHRVEALERLGCKNAPCLLIDYRSDRIKVVSWDGGEEISKETVLEAGISGRLLPPRTTRHLIILPGREVHVSEIQPELRISFRRLV